MLLPAPSYRYDPLYLEAGARELLYLGQSDNLGVELTRAGSPLYWARYLVRLCRHVWRIRKILRQYEIDLVHTHASSFVGGAIAARWCGIPCAIHLHEYPFLLPVWARQVYWRVLPRLGSALICCADFIRRAFVAVGCPPERVHTVYNGVDLAAFRPDRNSGLRAELGIPPEHCLVGFAGRLSPRKGVEYFLEAAQILLAERTALLGRRNPVEESKIVPVASCLAHRPNWTVISALRHPVSPPVGGIKMTSPSGLRSKRTSRLSWQSA